ncbi:MAG: hypothetical protein NUV77_25960, partial [Thermoguttaceae bacterium]|nr:hypothetical protein [Thermoguttaceae bacterium]
MSKGDSDILRSGMNPLTEAILEAAEDLEKGRPLASGAESPDLAAAQVPPASAPLDELPEEPAPAEPEEIAAPEEVQAGSFWDRLAEVNPYTVMLAVALAALIVGVGMLALELTSYGWDVKAR